MWIAVCLIISFVCLAAVALTIYIVVRLNKYIVSLEETVERYSDQVDNLQDSLQLALKEKLFKDGTVKKPLVSVDEE